MIAARLRAAGFDVTLNEAGELAVTPFERLTPDQCHWIDANVDALKLELCAETARTERDVTADRWMWFLALADAEGLNRDAVAEHFSEQDIADLCALEHDDQMLRRCMRSLANDSKFIAGPDAAIHHKIRTRARVEAVHEDEVVL